MTEQTDPMTAVQALEQQLAAAPADPDLRLRLALALEALTVSARSVTREGMPVVTSARQRDLCAWAARRILELNVPDARLTTGAQGLLAELEAGRRWVWLGQGQFAVAAVVALGLAAVVLGGLTGVIAVVVAGAVVSSALLAVLVLRFRRERWRVEAERLAPVIWRPGI
ncbi:hypothetical protein L1857_33020 [Amycolatopsis thermalba]|uniref:Transmembrane protein n=1 Tax=Amycolatopsis thermalba TaxID=944492 RepID=A0ABY4P4H3_9PSEU|nr:MULTISPECIES: hypothetical protein [Amycolatopsis]UQS27281.1 hypothetical protein L1857_33020 [Amycolatopsis thermalba]